ncbi:GMC oxidoreductase [Pseudorhodoferax sp.]|uniref:GMC oxidoreductase n=1 Tax=Pseudorhodoferax sp. TaxID=1993553 RepID=UPI002DD67E0E|nr:GMC oxidoreductase [Pseudorhodoferax sp.]
MFEFAVVGGGATGYALALQLASDAAVQVALVEAGPPCSRRRPRPAWRWSTVAQPGLNGRAVALTAGKGLGGTAAWGERAAPLPQPDNLTVFTDALAVRVLLQGRRATGLEFHRAGLVQQLLASRAVVLCAGALQSPLLLMRSGIGPHVHLVAENVATRHDLPGVGQGLQVPVHVAVPLRRAALAALALRRPAECVELVLDRPASRGRLRLAGKDPYQPPRLDPDLLSERDDLEALVRQARAVLDGLGPRAARPWAGPLSDLALERLLRERAEPGPGVAGGCSLGDGPLDVVDAQLAVRGVAGLHVADASVLAQLPADGQAVAALGAQLAQRLLRG